MNIIHDEMKVRLMRPSQRPGGQPYDYRRGVINCLARPVSVIRNVPIETMSLCKNT